MTKGKFIVFEGIDGSGKSIQAKLLHDTLLSEGKAVILTREPGGTELANRLRDIILEKAKSPGVDFFLFMAARMDHLHKVIVPSLERGTTVICDRYIGSTLAHQSSTDIDWYSIYRTILDFIPVIPDLTFYLSCDVKTALQRKYDQNEIHHFEKSGITYMEKSKRAFDLIYSTNTNHMFNKLSKNSLIVTQDTVQEMHNLILQFSRALLINNI